MKSVSRGNIGEKCRLRKQIKGKYWNLGAGELVAWPRRGSCGGACRSAWRFRATTRLFLAGPAC